MSIDNKAQASNARRRCRLGMVGGGQGAFIGGVHRIAARLDDRYELVAGAFSSDPERSKASAVELGVADARAYGHYEEMAKAEAARDDGIDVVAIVTPNHMHHGPAKAFLEAGIHVICDKPLCTSLGEARELVKAVDTSKKIFALTHNYTGYPMVRQMREMVASGEIGDIRVIQVEYAQDWLATKLEETGQKQASWRTDPMRSGAGGCIGDIGTHAYNLAAFTSGLRLHSLCADMQSFVEGRRLDDNCNLLLRYEGGARGMLWSSQVSPGNENGLAIRLYGTKAGPILASGAPQPPDLHPARRSASTDHPWRRRVRATAPAVSPAFRPAIPRAISKVSRTSIRMLPNLSTPRPRAALRTTMRCSFPRSGMASTAWRSFQRQSNRAIAAASGSSRKPTTGSRPRDPGFRTSRPRSNR